MRGLLLLAALCKYTSNMYSLSRKTTYHLPVRRKLDGCSGGEEGVVLLIIQLRGCNHLRRSLLLKNLVLNFVADIMFLNFKTSNCRREINFYLLRYLLCLKTNIVVRCGWELEKRLKNKQDMNSSNERKHLACICSIN